jgi:hypothetical protein
MNIHYQKELLSDWSGYTAVTKTATQKTAPKNFNIGDTAPSLITDLQRRLESAQNESRQLKAKLTANTSQTDCSKQNKTIEELTKVIESLKYELKNCEQATKEKVTKYSIALKECEEKLDSCGKSVNVKIDTPPIVNLGTPTTSRIVPSIPTSSSGGAGGGSEESSTSIKKQSKEWLPLLVGVTGLAVAIWKPFKQI